MMVDPQAVLDRPRFCIEANPERSRRDAETWGKVALEEGVPEETIATLAHMGHPVEMVGGHGRVLFGRGQIILRDTESGALWGGSDPRADGCAMSL
jgi:gamma-glutamyltranspeptidase/glutathione hydrolase